MKKVIDRNSWHYRLMNKLDIYPSQMDICAYTRALMKALLLTSILAIGAGLIVVSFGEFFGWIAAMISMWVLTEPGTLALIATGFAAVAVIIGCMFCVEKFWKILPAPPEDVQAMWDSIHNKICVQIEITREE